MDSLNKVKRAKNAQNYKKEEVSMIMGIAPETTRKEVGKEVSYLSKYQRPIEALEEESANFEVKSTVSISDYFKRKRGMSRSRS